jgi:elongation factor P
MIDTTAIKKDVFLRFNNGICVVTDFQHVSPGKGSAFVRVRLKNVQTGKTIEHTYKAGEEIDVVELTRMNMQFLYKDADFYYFMDQNFEQHAINGEIIGDKGQYLREGSEVVVLMNDTTPLAIDIAKKMTFTIVEAAPAVKGNTASGGNMTKEVKLDNGMMVHVPMFMNQGDKIVVNTDSGEYSERSNE